MTKAACGSADHWREEKKKKSCRSSQCKQAGMQISTMRGRERGEFGDSFIWPGMRRHDDGEKLALKEKQHKDQRLGTSVKLLSLVNGKTKSA